MITISNIHVNYIKKKKTLKLKHNKPMTVLDLELHNELILSNHGVLDGPYYIEGVSACSDYYSNGRIIITLAKGVGRDYTIALNHNTWAKWAPNTSTHECTWRPPDNYLHDYFIQ